MFTFSIEVTTMGILCIDFNRKFTAQFNHPNIAFLVFLEFLFRKLSTYRKNIFYFEKIQNFAISFNPPFFVCLSIFRNNELKKFFFISFYSNWTEIVTSRQFNDGHFRHLIGNIDENLDKFFQIFIIGTIAIAPLSLAIR